LQIESSLYIKELQSEGVILDSQTLEGLEIELQRIRHLLVIEDTQGQHAVCLDTATYSIGRDPTNSIVLHSRLVSRQHAILLRVTTPETASYSFRIIDGDLQGKRSTNGLIINGRRCFSHDLKHGDIIVFGGDVKARYCAVSNLSDAEFLEQCEAKNFSSFVSHAINPLETIVSPPIIEEPEDLTEAALVRLASFPEMVPNPILEIDLSGVITYLNPAALMLFPTIQEAGLEHPMLEGLLTLVETVQGGQEKFFVREVEVDYQTFEQSVHYISESDLIRSYVTDVTQRKRAEEQLRQQAQREAIINRIVQAMRVTLVPSEVLRITADLLPEALGVSHCLIVQTGSAQVSDHYISPTAVEAQLVEANVHFTEHFRSKLAQGEQVFLAGTDASLVPELKLLAQQCGIQTILITPLLYLHEYLGSISLYQCGKAALRPGEDYRRWTVDELSDARTIADQCAIAIHQAQLYQQVQDLNAHLERQVQERTAELQQKMQELQRLNMLKDDFLSTVSHELRTPMANIKMAIHMLKQSPLEARQERYLKILENECNRETDLINDLLDLQRLEAGVEPVGLEVLHLNSWLPSVIEPFQSRTQHRQQSLRVEYPADLPSLSSDRAWLERILVELLNNACKYTPNGGEILLSVSFTNLPDPRVTFRVTNEARIPSTELPRIFDKFYRISNSDPWKQGGTGLGLALVKKLVERLEGQISVESNNGLTTFIVELPQRRISLP